MANDNVTNVHVDVKKSRLGGIMQFVPGFLYIFVIYLIGRNFIPNPRAAFTTFGVYSLSWVEVLLMLSTVVALFEQNKVSHPGIDNTMEALIMVGMGVVNLILFILGAAKIAAFSIFNNTEFLIITFISLLTAVIAILINARTLRRSIGIGDN
ncbi:MAG: hypothetical protein WCT04_14260 [Planctomycetota bacterium]